LLRTQDLSEIFVGQKHPTSTAWQPFLLHLFSNALGNWRKKTFSFPFYVLCTQKGLRYSRERELNKIIGKKSAVNLMSLK
jgi:hypothetical protein